MKRTLALVGAGALVAWTGLGLLAWATVTRHVTIVLSDEEDSTARTGELSALADQLGALHQDLRALASAMGENLQALNDGLAAGQDEHAAALALRIDALRGEVTSRAPSPSLDRQDDLLRELVAVRDALQSLAVPGGAVRPVPSSAPETIVAESTAAAVPAPPSVAPAEPAPEAGAARGRKSFLAFRLPSDDFRFDERRSWTILPALSRVGFDARTTLHDFTATTSSLEGMLEADLSHPESSPKARLRVQAALLGSGDGDRDEAMREHLATEEHPTLEFELTRFTPGKIDAAALSVSGEAHGRMTIRGVTQEVAMPVRLSIDDARRLCVEGAMTLDLERFRVPVPNKLGLITMDEEVEVWISLRLRADPRSEG